MWLKLVTFQRGRSNKTRAWLDWLVMICTCRDPSHIWWHFVHHKRGITIKLYKAMFMNLIILWVHLYKCTTIMLCVGNRLIKGLDFWYLASVSSILGPIKTNGGLSKWRISMWCYQWQHFYGAAASIHHNKINYYSLQNLSKP